MWSTAWPALFSGFAATAGASETCAGGTCEEHDTGSLVQVRAASAERSQRRTDYQLSAYCGPSWLVDCSLVPAGFGKLNGAFDPNVNAKPPRTPGAAADNSLVIGGANVGIGQQMPSAMDVATMMSLANCDDITFDMEGILKGQFQWARNSVMLVKGIKPGAKARMAALAGSSSSVASIAIYSLFDTIGIMIHGGSMSSGRWSIPESDPKSGFTYQEIMRWVDSSIPNNKIALALTTDGLEGHMVNFLKGLIAVHGLAGMSFWKIQDLPPSIPLACIEHADVSCTAASCMDQCVSGEADGQCCNPDSTTSIGSCTRLGQEGCCGGTGSAPFICQKTSLTAEKTSLTAASCKDQCVSGKADGQCCNPGSTTSIGSCTRLGQEGCCGGTGSAPFICQKT